MKVAVFSDLHAHKYKEFDKVSDLTGSTRLDSILDVLDQIRDYCLDMQITQILFAGDMFHVRGRVDTVVQNRIYDKIKEICNSGIKILAIPGNHDDHNNKDLPEHSLHMFKDIEGMTVVDTLDHYVLDDGTPVVCCRYSKNAQMIKDYINSIDPSQFEDQPLLLAHLGVSGGLIGKSSYVMADAFSVEDLRPDVFKYIILGHFHRRQFLGGYKHVLYTGAPLQHSFSDEGEHKGFYIVDTSRRCQIDFVPLESPMFHTVTKEIIEKSEECTGEHIQGNILHMGLERGDFFRVLLKENEVDWFNAIASKYEGLQYKIVLEKQYTQETRVDVQVGMPFEEIVSKYAEEFNPDAKEVGLKILSAVQDK